MTNQANSSPNEKPTFILKAMTGLLAGQNIKLAAPSLMIGREPGVDLLIDQEQVSRHHASLTWTGNAWVLKDLDSSNGTFVNGRRIQGAVPVRPGDSIGFGTEVLFQLSTSQSAGAVASAPAGAAVSGTAGRKGKSPLRWFIPLAALLLLILGAAGAAWFFFLRPPAERTRPVVWFEDPHSGASVTTGEELSIHAVAQDDNRISRFELWLDGTLVEVQNSTLPDGTSPFILVTRLSFNDAGDHTLIARAFDTSGERAHASVRVTVEAFSDLDADSIPDDEDTCPSEGGLVNADGCPDSDGDGIADRDDACPLEAGLPGGAGCPVPSEGDRDGDGLADAADACPDTPGAPRSEGCPDADGDGVPDAEDACPDEAGLPGAPGGAGCPGGTGEDRDGDTIPDVDDACPAEAGAPSSDGCPDMDGDGIPDAEDACPADPGPPGSGDDAEDAGCPAPGEGDSDGDGIPDAEDACPDEAGTFATEGCPDRDGDGVPDAEDHCPDDAGIGSAGDGGAGDDDGCPADPADGGVPGGGDDGLPGDGDSDGDGVPDRADLCPDDPGTAENAGCPETDSGDADGDGLEDAVDLCPEEPGLPEHAGCPPPGEGADSDGDGIPDDVEAEDSLFDDLAPLFPEDEPVDFLVPVEFEALTFAVNQTYYEIYCYAALAGVEMERYGPFDPLGLNRWDIGAYLGRENSRLVNMPGSDPLEVRAECYGNTAEMGPFGIEYRTDDLGMIYALHPVEDWDSHVIEMTSAASESGEQFDVTYRICTPSCEQSAFPSPSLRLLHGGGDHFLLWSWDGDESQIDGFHVYMNGSHIFSVPADARSQSVFGFAPPCGGDGRREFTMTAYQGDRESMPSNLAFWSSQDCPRVVTVSFQGISTFDMGDDEYWAEGTVGPIYGGFHASGSSSETLSFNAADPGDWWGQHASGFRVRNTRYYEVQGIFDWVHTQMASCLGNGCPVYNAPVSNTVSIELAPYQDLTFGGYIRDLDSNNPDDVLFDGERTLAFDEIRPGLFTVYDRNVELAVLIDVIVGPEAGANPDLTITDVSRHDESGQLRIHVFNNAIGLVGQDLDVRLERLDGTHIGTYNWENFSIPTGGSRILMNGDLVMEPSDLRVILDPENRIAEMNEENNTFETPVRVQVEFIRAWAPHCNESSCSIFDCDSEHVFQVFAGFGLARSDVEWVGYNVRFPRDGHLRSCGSPCTSDPDEDWYMEGNDRYIFEFDIPADQDLYIMVTGYEKDIFTNDDSLGFVLRSYGMEDNWGEQEEPYSGNYGETCICDDAACSPCHEGLTAWWRITRVR